MSPPSGSANNQSNFQGNVANTNLRVGNLDNPGSFFPAVPQYLLANGQAPPHEQSLQPAPLLALSANGSPCMRTNTESYSPVSQVDVVGAVQCKVTLSGELAQCIIDTGNGISLVNRSFVAKHRIPTVKWQGPFVMVAEGGILERSLRDARRPFRIESERHVWGG